MYLKITLASEHTDELASHWHLEVAVVQLSQQVFLFESFEHLARFYFHLNNLAHTVF